jgi:hypothetical protein
MKSFVRDWRTDTKGKVPSVPLFKFLLQYILYVCGSKQLVDGCGFWIRVFLVKEWRWEGSGDSWALRWKIGEVIGESCARWANN